MLRSLIAYTLVLSATLALLLGAAIFVGFQQPPSEWAQLLHLNDCELPCWIDIVPGKTTLTVAYQKVEQLYASASGYALEKDENNSAYLITSQMTGQTFALIFDTDIVKPISTSVVHSIWLNLNTIRSLPDSEPMLAELYHDLGNAEIVRRITGVEYPRLTLQFRYQRVEVFTDDSQCDKVTPTQRISTIFIVDQPPGDNMAWLSPPSSWAGFNRCYDLEVKVYP